MSFMMLPPEVNSGLMYTGPGSAPLMAAATAWDGLHADLASTATSIQSVISGLTSSWQGPSSTLLVSAAAPYVAWLESTAGQAAQVGAQAKTAAGLFETVHAATVPPPVIAANRALLLALISTNFFGQNTPAIMATEAHYEEMWAQDGAAMDGYMAASQTNNEALQKPTPAPQVAKAQSMPTLSAAENGTSTSWTDLWNAAANGDYSALGTDLSSLLTQAATGAGAGGSAASSLSGFQALYYPLLMATLPLRVLLSMLMQVARMGSMGSAGLAGQTAGAAGTGTLMTQIGEFVDGKLQGAVGTLVGHFSSATNAISAKLGQAASMGALKVPQAWSMAADGMTRAAPVLPATTVSAPVQTMSSGMPGGPFGNAMMGALAGRGIGGVAAKAPKVIPRSPAGG